MNITRLLSLSLLALLTPALNAYTVIRDASQPPVEKLVLFEKGKATDRLTFFSAGNNGFTVATDGSLQLRMDNNEPVEAGVRWPKGSGLSNGVQLTDYGHVLVTCRLEGAFRTTLGNGEVQSKRADNLWCSLVFFGEEDKRVALANMADVTADGATPQEMVTLKIPVILLTYWGEKDTPLVHGFGFKWGGARPPAIRDFLLVIERVALAD